MFLLALAVVVVVVLLLLLRLLVGVVSRGGVPRSQTFRSPQVGAQGNERTVPTLQAFSDGLRL